MAGRIPQGFIDDLLERVDIVDVIDARVVLKKAGRNYKGLCPFHNEKSPSFSVNADKQFYHCFGCGAGGNAVSFMMDYENLEFPQAVEALAASISMEVPREENNSFTPAVNNNKALYTLLDKCAQWFHHNLRTANGGQAAVDYLKQRGLDGQTASNFQIGYAAAGWDNLLKEFGDSEDNIKLLVEGGMLIEKEAGGYYDRFRDRIMFPIRDKRGRVVAFGGRVLGDEKPKYLNSPETPVFSKGRELYGYFEARKSKKDIERIVVVEGYMDVVALAQAGIPYATATLGTATSSSHLEQLFRLCPEVEFCFDGDKAGQAAANRALDTVLPLMRDGLQARFLFLPDGEDPDTLVRDIGASRFEHQIETALPLSEYLFEHVSAGLDISSMDGRARLSSLALPLIDTLPQGVLQSLMHKELANRTGLEVETLDQLRQQEQQKKQQALEHKKKQDQLANEKYKRDKVTPTPIDANTLSSAKHTLGSDDAPPAKTAKYYAGSVTPEDQDFTAHYPTAKAPKQRPVKNDFPQQRSNIQNAITLLLFYPQNIDAISDFGIILDHYQDEDSELLKEMVEFLKKHPTTPTYTLLGNWIGTKHYSRLQLLLQDDQLITDKVGARHQLTDIFGHLDTRQTKRQLEEELDQLANISFTEMSSEQKKRYSELLTSYSKQ